MAEEHFNPEAFKAQYLADQHGIDRESYLKEALSDKDFIAQYGDKPIEAPVSGYQPTSEAEAAARPDYMNPLFGTGLGALGGYKAAPYVGELNAAKYVIDKLDTLGQNKGAKVQEPTSPSHLFDVPNNLPSTEFASPELTVQDARYSNPHGYGEPAVKSANINQDISTVHANARGMGTMGNEDPLAEGFSREANNRVYTPHGADIMPTPAELKALRQIEMDRMRQAQAKKTLDAHATEAAKQEAIRAYRAKEGASRVLNAPPPPPPPSPPTLGQRIGSTMHPSGFGGKLLTTALTPAAGAAAGYLGTDAFNRFAEGDNMQGAISGIGAGSSLAAMHPNLRGKAAGLAVLAPVVNYLIDKNTGHHPGEPMAPHSGGITYTEPVKHSMGGQVQHFGPGGTVLKDLVEPFANKLIELSGMKHPIAKNNLRIPYNEMSRKVIPDTAYTAQPTKIWTPEDLYKGMGVPNVGDMADTGNLLTHVNNRELINPFTKEPMPVQLQGGRYFNKYNTYLDNPEKSAGWASQEEQLSGLLKQVQKSGKSGKDVYGINVIGSPQNVDFNNMMSHGLMGQMDFAGIHPDLINQFNAEVQKKYPKYLGIDNPDVMDQLMAPKMGKMRTHVVRTMEKKPYQEGGFPDVPSTRKAVTDPELLNLPIGTSGLSISKFNPEGIMVKDPVVPHNTYKAQGNAEYAGEFAPGMGLDYKDIFQTSADARKILPGHAPSPDDYRSFSVTKPAIQDFNDQWLDRVMPSYEKIMATKNNLAAGGLASVKKFDGGGEVESTLPPISVTAPRPSQSEMKAYLATHDENTGAPKDALGDFFSGKTNLSDSLTQAGKELSNFPKPSGLNRVPSLDDPEVQAAMALAPMGLGTIKGVGGQWMPSAVSRLERYLTDRYGNDNISNWLQTTGKKYILNRAGTPSDEIRLLADQGITHVPPEESLRRFEQSIKPSLKDIVKARIDAGFPGVGHAETNPGSMWEANADMAIQPYKASQLAPFKYEMPWLDKLDPNTPVHDFTFSNTPNMLGMDHLANALRSDISSGKLRPEQLNKVSISDAVNRAHQQRGQLEQNKNQLIQGVPTVKEYPNGFHWKELTHQDPATLDAILKKEGDTMQNCIGGYGSEVIEDGTKLYSLRDPAGNPHANIEVRPGDEGPEIRQIKGKQNEAPNVNYQSYIQDFVQNPHTGQEFFNVNDLENTGLINVGKLKSHGLAGLPPGAGQSIDAELNRIHPRQPGQFGGFESSGQYGNRMTSYSLLKNLTQDLPGNYVNEQQLLNHLQGKAPRPVQESYSNFYDQPTGMAGGGKVGAITSLLEAAPKIYQGAKDLILPPAENAARTQIIGTLPTYQKASDMFQKLGATGKPLDFGAGLGEGAKIMNADTFEPYAKNWTPTYTNAADIPSDAYGKLTNLNVLNVMPREMRDQTVSDIGRVMDRGGLGILTTRGNDVMKAQGRPGPEPTSIITTRDTYQKGFNPQELEDYLKYILGNKFDINKLNLGPAGALIRKK